MISALSGGDDLPKRTASRKGSPSSLSRGGKEETQEKVPGAEPQFLLYGCELCTDGSLECRLLHSPLSAYRREKRTDRRMLLQEEAALKST
ncbi:hypothetical protein LEMLEM_LOCUS3421 [Lemmus lemmus]